VGEFAEAGGLEFRDAVGVAGRALVGLWEDVRGDVVKGPLFGIEDIFKGVSVDGIGSGDNADEDGV
jgi:hypothetical protein